jgi:CRISPR/Cas system-associated exonuclease Cas4 (RecB family)
MLGYPKLPMEPRIIRITDNGDKMHERYQNWFKELGILVENEYPIKFPELRISGRIDSIINLEPLIPGFNDIAIVELKSANAKKCEFMTMNNAPNHEYVDQLQLYMGLLKIPQGIVLVENKNDQQILEFWVQHDEAYAQKLIDKVKLVNNCVDKNELPPRDYTASSYQCKYCDFKTFCRNENAVCK